MGVKYKKKNTFWDRLKDNGVLLVVSILSGLFHFGVSWLKEQITWLGDLIAIDIVPQTLSSYDFWGGIIDILGLDFFGSAVAVIIALWIKDNSALDEVWQMFLGCVIGTFISVLLLATEIYTVSSFVNAGIFFTIISWIIYQGLRGN